MMKQAVLSLWVCTALLWADGQSETAVIVQYRNRPSGARAAHRGPVRDLKTLNARAMRVTPEELEQLRNDPDVISVDEDLTVSATDFNGKMDYGWMTVTGLSSMTGTLPYTGRGIAVAVLDSGLDEGAEFRDALGNSRIVYRQHFVDSEVLSQDPYGHGVHVAGIIGGNGALSTGTNPNGSQYSWTYRVRGIAPDVKLLDMRVLNRYGKGTDSAVIAAIDRVIQLKNTYNIRVINLSLGRPVVKPSADDPLCQAVKKAWEAGIVVVVAAGNEGRNNLAKTNGYGTITSPGNSPYVITVGAMNTKGTLSRGDDTLASYSSKGPTLFDRVVKPDLVAPGNAIAAVRGVGSTLDNTYQRNGVPISAYSTNPSTQVWGYYQISGSSVAAPMVAGAAAVLLEKTPSLTPDLVKARLMKTAFRSFPGTSTATDPATGQSYTTNYDVFSLGAGMVDLPAALNNYDALPAGTKALSPTVTYDEASRQVKMVTGSGLVWATGVIWGTGLVWGTLVDDYGVIWGTGLVWGTAEDEGFGVIWGTGLVWGTGIPQAESTTLTLNGDQ